MISRRTVKRCIPLLVALNMFLASGYFQSAGAQGDSLTFPETGKSIQGKFLAYWRANGGLAQQGYPLTGEQVEMSPVDGKLYTIQYFERAIFELHPENKEPYDVLLSLLGVFSYRQKYPAGAPNQHPNVEHGSILFKETGMHVGGAFLDYWQRNGGLAQQGFPISEEFTEVSDLSGKPYKVQYFQRAVFELHPENSPPNNILLSQLGTLRLREVQSNATFAAGSVVPTEDMQLARACHTSTLLANGKVLIAGGMQRDGEVTATTELYDPVSESFSPAGDMLSSRVCHSAVALNDGKVLIVGGFAGRELVDKSEVYDPASGKFAMTGSMTRKRDGFTATMLKSGKVLITGGSDHNEWTATAELYDPGTGTFSPTGTMTSPRAAHTATPLPDGRVLITGGSRSNSDVLATAEIYDPATGTFKATESMSVVRYKHAAALLPNGKVLVAGGSDSRDWRGRYASAELYDPASGKFTPTGNMHDSRFKNREALVLIKSGKVLAAGSGTAVEIYDSQSGKFTTATGEVDVDRFYTTATVLQDGRVLITGGYDYDIVSGAKAWLYNPGK